MTSPDEPPQRAADRPRRRTIRWLAGTALVVVVAAVASVISWRLTIADAVLRAALERAGYPGAALSVTALSLSEMRLADIRLGRDIAIAAAVVKFDFTRLPAQPVARLSLDRVRLDLAVPGTRAGSAITLREALESAADLPAVTIRDLSLAVAVDGQPLTVSGDIEAGGDAADSYAGRFALRIAGALPGETRALSLNGTARLDSGSATIDATLASGDGAAAGSLTLRAEMAPEAARIGGELRLDVTQPDRLTPLVPLLAGAAGTLRLSARTTEPVAVPPDITLDASGLAEALGHAGAGGIAINGSVEDGQHPAGLSGLSGTVSAAVRSSGLDGRLTLRASELAAAGVTVADATLSGPFRIDRERDAVSLLLPQPLQLAAAEIVTADGAVAIEPLAVAVSGGRTHALRLFAPESPRQPDLRLRLELAGMALRSGAGAGRRIALAPAILRLAATRDPDGTLHLHLQSAALSAAEAGRQAVIEDLALSLRQAGVSGTGDVRGRLSLREAGQPLVAPIGIRCDFALWRDILTFDGKAEALAAVSMTARGRHDFIAGRGTAELALEPVRFAPGRVELRRLAPALSGIGIAAGAVAASASLAWGSEAPAGTAALRIDGMDLAAAGVTIEGLSADIRLDRLIPPHTPPGQTVRVRRVAAGLSLDDLVLRFAVGEGASPEAPAVRLETLTAGFAGGRMAVLPTVIDTGDETHRARIEVADVDLAVLLGLLGMEDVSGTGRVSGAIPLARTGKALALDGGRLAADGPGVLRIRSEAAKAALAGGGEDVALMLSALEDFRYESLTLGIEKPFEGPGRLVLSTRGHNPAVRDGQPFIINVNVSGNVDQLAAIAARLLELPGAVLRSMVPGAP